MLKFPVRDSSLETGDEFLRLFSGWLIWLRWVAVLVSFTAQEEERARVARELHDQIGQSLSALQIKITRLINLRRYGPGTLNEIKTDVAERIDEVRSLSSQIRPPALDECR